MATKELKSVKPDAKGRITLGILAKGVSSYIIIVDKSNRIILEPRVEVAANEKWLFLNKKALTSVRQGLKDSAAGNIKSRGSFANYLKDKETK